MIHYACYGRWNKSGFSIFLVFRVSLSYWRFRYILDKIEDSGASWNIKKIVAEENTSRFMLWTWCRSIPSIGVGRHQSTNNTSRRVFNKFQEIENWPKVFNYLQICTFRVLDYTVFRFLKVTVTWFILGDGEGSSRKTGETPWTKPQRKMRDSTRSLGK